MCTMHAIPRSTTPVPGRRRRRQVLARTAAALVSAVALVGIGVGSTLPVGADGTETLGTPSVTIAPATGAAVGTIGLFVQPASLQVTIPADAVVTQALLYVEAGHRTGDTSGAVPDNTLVVDGTELTGTMVGGPTAFYGDVITNTQRFDLTALGLVRPGTTVLTLDGLDSDEVDDGAGLLVLFRQPGRDASVSVLDGNDIAFANFAAPLDATVPQTFRVTPASVARTASLALLVGSVHDPAIGAIDGHRPHAVVVTSGGVTTTLPDAFVDRGGREFDNLVTDVTIPAGAETVTVQLQSRPDATGDLPASLVWVAAALSTPTPAPVTPTSAAVTTITAVPPSVLPTVPPAQLAYTGTSTAAPFLFGVVLLTAGASLLVLVARRRPVHRSS